MEQGWQPNQVKEILGIRWEPHITILENLSDTIEMMPMKTMKTAVTL